MDVDGRSPADGSEDDLTAKQTTKPDEAVVMRNTIENLTNKLTKTAELENNNRMMQNNEM